MKFSAKITVPENQTGSLRAFATLVIDELIELQGLRVVEGAKGLFVAMPSTKSNKKDEEGKDIWYDNIRFQDWDDEAKSSATRQLIGEIVLAAYNKQTKQNTRQQSANARTTGARPTNNRPANRTTEDW